MLAPGTKQSLSIDAEVLEEVDVAVAGGGTAGVVAAIAAARTGAKTVLIERYAYLGGMLTGGNAGLTMYMKWSGKPEEQEVDMKALKEDADEVQVVGGIPLEMTNRLIASGDAVGTGGTGGRYVFPDPAAFKTLLLEMMEEAGVELRLHSSIVEVVQEDDHLRGLVLYSKSGFQLLPAKQVIDATGDGDVGARAGVPFFKGVSSEDVCSRPDVMGHMQAAGAMFRIGNVDLRALFAWLKEDPERYEKHPFGRQTLAEAERCAAANEMTALTIVTGTNPGKLLLYNSPLNGVVTGCYVKSGMYDCTKVEDLTAAEIQMAKDLAIYMTNLKEHVPGFNQAYLHDCQEIGVRETRHIEGDYLLGLMDIYEQKEFPDCIGLGSHPIDCYPRPEWINDPETSYPPRWFFQIPFRTLLAKGKQNLLLAGRCHSATHEAFGCTRPTIQCMIIGEAAGAAAGLAVKKGVTPRELDYEELRGHLKEQGVKC